MKIFLLITSFIILLLPNTIKAQTPYGDCPLSAQKYQDAYESIGRIEYFICYQEALKRELRPPADNTTYIRNSYTTALFDDGNFLTELERREITENITKHNKKSRIKIKIVTLTKIPDGDDIESISQNILSKITGQEKILLIVLSKTDRKIRIDQSHSKPPHYADEFVESLIKEIIPYFSNNKFKDGLIRIIKSIDSHR